MDSQIHIFSGTNQLLNTYVNKGSLIIQMSTRQTTALLPKLSTTVRADLRHLKPYRRAL